ncbi:uncharacterized protein LOC103513367, partial [Diaphorina citri]|uniref:Uncharacterized protein LOC103513367 n=1 Tax=Diaphorina citri TaxID=121845 RepID=A0A1S3D9K4_DIACI
MSTEQLYDSDLDETCNRRRLSWSGLGSIFYGPCCPYPRYRGVGEVNWAWCPSGQTPYGRAVWYFKQPTWRLWGEERVEGAIFNIYLKKVRYHRPAKSISS